MADISPGVSTDPVAVAVRSIHAMATGGREEFDALYHPAAHDRENRIQPPTSRVAGPEAFWSTAQWLRAAFADLHYDIHHAVAHRDRVVVDCTMNGTHTAPWTVYTDTGEVDTVFPPTGRTFSADASHWFALKQDLIREHWATRDDLGMARQLGWIPPGPRYLLRMSAATRRARRTSPR